MTCVERLKVGNALVDKSPKQSDYAELIGISIEGINVVISNDEILCLFGVFLVGCVSGARYVYLAILVLARYAKSCGSVGRH